MQLAISKINSRDKFLNSMRHGFSIYLEFWIGGNFELPVPRVLTTVLERELKWSVGSACSLPCSCTSAGVAQEDDMHPMGEGTPKPSARADLEVCLCFRNARF